MSMQRTKTGNRQWRCTNPTPSSSTSRWQTWRIGDIQECAELEQGKNVDFWRDMTTIMEYEMAKLLNLEASGEDLGKHRA